ncbi:hypothetical protein ExPUPEC79_00385 [Escherichia coli]|nr:hypothetical protein ExPUPEC79_00385 [Escherichia coli]
MQVFRKAIRFAHFSAFFINDDFLVEVNLATMCFVRDANDIVAFRKEFGVFGEFMDRCQKDSATIASCQLITQIFTAGNGNDGVVANVIFGVAHLRRKLIVQIGAVGDQNNGRAGKLHALHQKTR